MTPALDRLWYTRCGVPTGFGLAKQHGLLDDAFAAQGILLASLKESPDPTVRASHFDHSLKNSVRYGGSAPAIWARSIGSDTRLLGVSRNRDGAVLIAGPDSGISTVRDLRGRRFGLPLFTDQPIDFARAKALRTLENALRLEGLEVADVEIVDYPVGGRIADALPSRIADTETFKPRHLPGRNRLELDLLRGHVDALASGGIHGYGLAETWGLEIIHDAERHPDPIARANNDSPLTLAVDRHLLDTRPDAVELLLRQILQAERWAGQHIHAARTLIAREINASEYWVWKAHEYDDAGLQLETSLDEDLLQGLQDFAGFLLRWGFIATPVDVAGWAEPAPLAGAISAGAGA